MNPRGIAIIAATTCACTCADEPPPPPAPAPQAPAASAADSAGLERAQVLGGAVREQRAELKERPAKAADPEAEKLFQQVQAQRAEIEARDMPFEIASGIGRMYYERGLYVDAVTFFLRALAKSENPEARRLLGEAFLAAGQPERAVAELARAATALPADAMLQYRLAQVIIENRQDRPSLEIALGALERFAALKPDIPIAGQIHTVIHELKQKLSTGGEMPLAMPAGVHGGQRQDL